MKKNQKRGLHAPANRAAERAMSRIIEGKKRHRRHGKRRSGVTKIARLAKAAGHEAQILS